MSAVAGRWRFRLDIHLNILADDDVDAVLAAVAGEIERALSKRNAISGAYNCSAHEALPKTEQRAFAKLLTRRGQS